MIYTKDNPLKIGIVGSRKFQSYSHIREFVFKLKEKFGKENIEIVSGEQKQGADGFAKRAALEFDIRYVSFPPAHYNWNQHCIKEAYHYGKEYRPYYYFQRNTEIAEYSDMIVAFIPQGIKIHESKGTFDTYTKAKNLGKKVFIMN